MNKGLVSVIVPVYNRENYVAETLDSILAQTYGNVEIIAVNDGSTDQSLSVLKEYERKFPDKFVVLDQENQGQVVARNNAILKSSGEYIAFLDSDDIWLPQKLEKQIPLFRDNVGLVYCGIYNIDDKGNTIDMVECEPNIKGDIYTRLLIKNRMTGGAVVLHRSAIDKVGAFDVNFRAAENWDLWIRVSKYFMADFINEPLIKYRKHSGNMSKEKLLMLDVIKNILDKHCSEEPASEKMKKAFDVAEANYFYRKGIYCFSECEYKQARENFRDALKLAPEYKDTKMRLYRTYLGKYGNKCLATVKTCFSK